MGGGEHPSVCSNNDCLFDIKLCFELTLRGSSETEKDTAVISEGSSFKMCLFMSANCLGHVLLLLAKNLTLCYIFVIQVMGGKDTKVSGLNLRFEIWGGHPSVCKKNKAIFDNWFCKCNDCLCDF